MIYFELNGKRIRPGDIGDAIMQVVLQNLEAHIREKVGSVRDPETGEFPTVVVRGDSLEDLQMHVEGSPEIIALVSDRLGLGTEKDDMNGLQPEGPPPS